MLTQLFGREWLSRLKRCSGTGRCSVQTLASAGPGLGTKPRYEAPGDLN